MKLQSIAQEDIEKCQQKEQQSVTICQNKT